MPLQEHSRVGSQWTTRWVRGLPGAGTDYLVGEWTPGGGVDYPMGLLALSTAEDLGGPRYSAGFWPSGQRNHFKRKKGFIFGIYQIPHSNMFPTRTDSSLKRLLSLLAQLRSRGDPVSLCHRNCSPGHYQHLNETGYSNCLAKSKGYAK